MAFNVDNCNTVLQETWRNRGIEDFDTNPVIREDPSDFTSLTYRYTDGLSQISRYQLMAIIAELIDEK